MKRFGNLLPRIATRDNVALAYHKAAAGRRRSPGVAAFAANLDAELGALVRELGTETWQPGGFHRFIVRDPKLRVIHAAAFRDRVVHHALMNVAGPGFEHGAVAHSYACRTGRGNRGAVAHAAACTRAHGWFLKLDIRRYFDSVDHAVLGGLLRRRFKDGGLVRLLERMVASYDTLSGGEGSAGDHDDTGRVHLPRPVRHEWGEISPNQGSRFEPPNRSAAVSQTSRSPIESAATGFQHSRAPVQGEGCFTRASGPPLPSASSPRPSPPFGTEERETEMADRTGLPIGTLTSQYFANFYLDGLDHWIHETLGCGAYVRYMDDFGLWHDDERVLQGWQEEIAQWLQAQRRLELKGSPRPARCREGVPFLGYRVTPRGVLLGRPARRRFVARLTGYEQAHAAGRMSERELQRRADALLAFVQVADCRRWRARVIAALPGTGDA